MKKKQKVVYFSEMAMKFDSKVIFGHPKWPLWQPFCEKNKKAH